MNNLSPVAKFLIKLSKKANKIMLKHYSPAGILAELKEDLSPVTAADLEINRMVINLVQKSYPDYEVLAEEISTDTSKSNKLFVVDPLDGTQMFAIGATMFGFSAAVVVDGCSVAGVLSNPLARRTLIAEKGKGAYLVETKTRIQVSEKDILDGAFVNSGWKDSRVSSLLHEAGARTPVVYSICEAASLVAIGGFDGVIFTGRFPHDIAALKVVVEEAGGKVVNIDGHEQRYDQTVRGGIISNGKLHEKLSEIVERSGIRNDFPENNK